MILRLVAGVVAALATATALACPICASGPVLTPAQRMIDADTVLLVSPSGGGPDTIDVVKGSDVPIPSGVPEQLRVPPGGMAILILRNGLSGQWHAIGAVARENLAWLREVAASKRTSEMTDADWHERVRFHQPRLEDPDRLVAEIAYGEIARAPYAAMQAAKPVLDAKRLVAWLEDGRLAARAPLYTLLLGIAGGPDATARIRKALDSRAASRDVPTLSALIAADLEVQGPARVAWVEKTYLAKGSSARDVQAALLALSVHAGAGTTIPRTRVIEAYQAFAKTGHPLAGYPAPELAGWSAWEAVPDYVALLKSRAPQHPASEVAILNYLSAAPGGAGKAAVAAYQASHGR